MSTATLVTYNYQEYYRRFGFEEVGSKQINGVKVDIMRLKLGDTQAYGYERS